MTYALKYSNALYIGVFLNEQISVLLTFLFGIAVLVIAHAEPSIFAASNIHYVYCCSW